MPDIRLLYKRLIDFSVKLNLIRKLVGQKVIMSSNNILEKIIHQPLQYINYLLIISAIFMALLIAFSIAFPSKLTMSFEDDENKTRAAAQEIKFESKSLNSYLKEFRKRDLFKGNQSSFPKAHFTTKDSTQKISKIIEKLSLLGVIHDEDPVAIIRDAGSGNALHYRIGDEISGLRIEKIEKSIVVLTDGTHQHELKL